MNIEQQLHALIIQKYGSLSAFTKMINMPYSTLDTALKRGIKGMSIQNMNTICNALKISVDEFCNGKIVPSLNTNTNNIVDFENLVKFYEFHINEYTLNISGKPMTDDQKNRLITMLNVFVGIMKEELK